MSGVISILTFGIFLVTFIISIITGIYYAGREEIPNWSFAVAFVCIISIIFYGILEFS
ncbi:MAG: membrane protein [Candidatus Syntrophoarchaeum caldarius]|uniref:Membrane protein n=1 Tax=Candidatus Syntropharchaeum caldarium TaxID=1838285 RepID=A0A1F2PC58_9EURY|nr:MAG: membrane protein [Candidatus Syntrophoarchaeum caldarius]